MADYDDRPRRPVDGTRRPGTNNTRVGADGRPRRPVSGARPTSDGARRPAAGNRAAGYGSTRRSTDYIDEEIYEAPRRTASGASAAGARRSATGTRRPTAGDGPRRTAGSSDRALSSAEIRRKRLIQQKEEMAKKKKNAITMLIIAAVVALLVIVGFVVFGGKKSNNQTYANNNGGNGGNPVVTSGATQAVPKNTNTPTPSPTPAPIEINFCAVGDDLVHEGVFKAGRQEDGSHDYSCLFKNVEYLIQDCDIKAINQETIFGGDEKGLQSYPNFNSPTAIADAFVKSGFNVVSHATNHAFDMGLDGLLNSVSYWKSAHPDIFMVGIYENATEQAEIPIMEVKGVKFAILNYTYSHNWETFSSQAEGHLNMLCAYNPDSRVIDFKTINPKVIEDIKKAEELADFTIIFPHWGTEYVLEATDQQKNFAKLMTEAGADLIVGTHPHVIEPVEWVTADNGNKSLCYYSLGNFTSTQDTFERLLGAMAKLTIVKEGDNVYIKEDSVKAIPLVTDYKYPGWSGGTIVTSTYSLANYTEEQAAAHGLKPRRQISVSRQGFVDLANRVFGDYCSIE